MAKTVETMLNSIKKYFKLDNVSNVNLTHKPRNPHENIEDYINNIDGLLSLHNRISTTLRKYSVTVFYYDNNDDKLHRLNLGIHEGHMIMSELEKANFFNSTNLWAVALSTPGYENIPANYWHSFYIYIS